MSDWNSINGSDSALGEGSFKRRDELRRAESVQRNKVKMSERLDRNIARAVRKGDARSAEAFNSLKSSITGQGYGGGGGITNSGDREQRVKDGTLKGAAIRWNAGNIGRADGGPITEAPPADSATPKNREGTGMTPDSSVSSSSGGQWVDVSGKQSVTANTQPQGGVQSNRVAPNSQTGAGPAQSSRGPAYAQTDMAIANLKAKWANEARANDPAAMQAAYEAQNGTPAQQRPQEQISANVTPVQPPKLTLEEIALGDKFEKVKSDAANLSGRMGDSVEFGKNSSKSYAQKEKERVAARDAGMAKIDQKLQSENARIDKGLEVQRGITKAYFNDLEEVSGRNAEYTSDLSSLNPLRSVPAALRGGVLGTGMEQYPAQPKPINYDTFDPKHPPRYERKLLSDSRTEKPIARYAGPSRGKGAVAQKADLEAIQSKRDNYYRQQVVIDAKELRDRLVAPPSNPLPR